VLARRSFNATSIRSSKPPCMFRLSTSRWTSFLLLSSKVLLIPSRFVFYVTIASSKSKLTSSIVYAFSQLRSSSPSRPQPIQVSPNELSPFTLFCTTSTRLSSILDSSIPPSSASSTSRRAPVTLLEVRLGGLDVFRTSPSPSHANETTFALDRLSTRCHDSFR
jgi:hypothetical protein